jgi:hypothetical protein
MTTITLPKLPRESHGFYVMMSSDTLRARDLEVARLVLEGAANVCESESAKWKSINYSFAASAANHCGRHIRKLEFKHHE